MWLFSGASLPTPCFTSTIQQQRIACRPKYPPPTYHPYAPVRSTNFTPKLLWSSVLVMVPSQFFHSLGVMADVTASSRPSGLVSLPGLVISAVFTHHSCAHNLYHPLFVIYYLGSGIFWTPQAVSLAYSGCSKIVEWICSKSFLLANNGLSRVKRECVITRQVLSA